MDAHDPRRLPVGERRPLLLALAGVVVAVLAGPLAAVSAVEPGMTAGASEKSRRSYSYSFLSSPDFLNTDVADVSSSPYYVEGMPNSVNESYARSLDTILSTFRAEGVTDLLVAGDLVEGHWWTDTAKTGTFGPLDSFADRRTAVRLAGEVYYGTWDRLVRAYGLRPFAALGDHDIGDNPWHDRHVKARQKRALVPTYKKVFADNILRSDDGGRLFDVRPRGPAKNTAYAHRLHPEVQLVSLDVFQKTSRNVLAAVDRQQMSWLEGVLRTARDDGVDWIIVQGHAPILTPVRSFGSSLLMYARGERSALWELLKKYDVNVYLAGEVHAVTAKINGGVAQIAHGGLFTSGRTNYLRVDVTRRQMQVTSTQFTAGFDKTERLWGMDEPKGGPGVLQYDAQPSVAGTMVITRDHELLHRTGTLAEYRP